ncbi:MAG: hypothetical protein ACT452_01545 [Microthrixaceae bacterium]
MGVRRGRCIAALVVLSTLVAVPLARAEAPSNDDRAAATAVSALAFDTDVDLSEATVEADEPDCYYWGGKSTTVQTAAPGSAAAEANPRSFGLKMSHDSPGSTTNTVWYRYTPATDERIVVDTLGSDPGQDTLLAAYVESPRWGFIEVGCSDDANGGLGSRMVVDAYAGETLLIQLGAFQGAASSAHLHIEVAPARGTISGLLTDDDTGAPIEGVCVSVIGDSTWGWVTSGPDGTYSVASDPGPVRVQFYTCMIDPGDGDSSYYPGELYDDVQDWEQATVLEVISDTDLPNIDAGLTASEWTSNRDVDFTVTSMDIEHLMPHADGVTAPVGPGLNRIVRIDIANLGSEWGFAAATVEVCPVSTPTSCYDVSDPQELYLDGGATERLTFSWNGLGTVGDVIVRASVASCSGESEFDNNVLEQRDYAVVGGLGYGASVPRTSHWNDCE